MLAGLGYMLYISRDAIERQLKSQSIDAESTYNWNTEREEGAAALETQAEATLETLQNP